MGASTDALAAKLADDVMNAMEETGNDRLFMEVAQVISAASQTMEEAFLSEVRFRQAEARGRKYMEAALARHRGEAPPETPE